MTRTGRCQCGAIRYEAEGEPSHHTLCHCGDCRRSAGAPVVGWIAYPADKLSVTGAPRVYRSSELAARHFCGTCGTGLFYYNETVLPGIVDIQSCTLDEPDTVPPAAEIQTAERLAWMPAADGLAQFERYPG
jgi:hypothetical protein